MLDLSHLRWSGAYDQSLQRRSAVQSDKERMRLGDECKSSRSLGDIEFYDLFLQVNCTSTPPPPGARPTQVLQLSESNDSSPFDYLCQLIDNDYVAHPEDCKQYAYCANGKGAVKRRLVGSILTIDVHIESIDQRSWEERVFGILGVPQSKLCKKTLLWSQAEKMCVWPAQSDCKCIRKSPPLSTCGFEQVPRSSPQPAQQRQQ